jgi:hypothetical protein
VLASASPDAHVRALSMFPGAALPRLPSVRRHREQLDQGDPKSQTPKHPNSHALVPDTRPSLSLCPSVPARGCRPRVQRPTRRRVEAARCLFYLLLCG